MSLTRIEQETGINFNEEEDFAIVYTAKESLKKKLDGFCKSHPKEFQRHILIGDDEEIKSYKIPKSYITFRTPKVLDEKEIARRKESSIRLTKIMAKRKRNSSSKRANLKDNKKQDQLYQ